MHLILNAHSSNAHYNGDCDYALVELTPALAERIRSRVAVARQARQQDSDLYELYFWGSTAEFFDHNILDACQEAVATAGRRRRDKAARDWLADFEGREYAVVPDGVDLNAHEAQRTECDQMIIQVSPSPLRTEFSIIWTASPKNSGVDVTTAELPLKAMEELLATTTHSLPPNPGANMRFTPWKCPECGRPAKGTVDMIPGLARLVFDDEGQAEYYGETEVDWDNQTTQHDEAGNDILECPAGHQWPAEREK